MNLDAVALELALRGGRTIAINPTGTSMIPLLRPGSTVMITGCSAEFVRVGEIVLFVQGEECLLHRVVSIERSDGQLRLITQGDARDRPDPPVHSSSLLGRLTSFGGTPSERLRARVVNRLFVHLPPTGVERLKKYLVSRHRDHHGA